MVVEPVFSHHSAFVFFAGLLYFMYASALSAAIFP